MNNTYHSFLDEVAHDLYQQYEEADIAHCTIILPSKKSAEKLQQVLYNKINNFALLPQVLTLEPWIEQLSKISIAPTLTLLVLLYQTFQKLNATNEPFERFYGWGNMLLQDFDILDKCLVNPDQLFANLYEQKALSLTYEYLSEVQKEAIKSFWKTFENRLSTQQQDFLQLWKVLPQIYKNFTSHLLENNIGYAGLCYRKLCNNLSQELVSNYRHLAIVGFNALHPAEEKIFAWLHSQISTEFYWDTDAYYMENENQEAGHYLRSHQAKSYFKASFQKPFPARIQTHSKKISFLEVNTVVGQTELVSTQLTKIIEEQGNKFRPSQTVIVLANEDLFLPMLYALPASLQSVNTSLGHPITHTASYQLIEQLLALQLIIKQPACPEGYLPAQAIIPLLQHTPIRYCDPVLAAQTIQTLTNKYTSYISQKFLAESSELYQVIFKTILSGRDITPYLIDVLDLIITHIKSKEKENPISLLEKQALSKLHEHFSHLQNLAGSLHEISIERFIELFRQLIQPIRLPLQEKTSADGIQIVRIWETANLDFKYVFIIGMNEGDLPTTTTQGSFIPYSLRKGYGLPTMDTFQASLDAYYFYRLLQRVQQVYITYSTASGVSNQKEMSRYLWQLLYESKLPIETNYVPATIYTPTIHPIIIKKDLDIVEKLEEFIVDKGQATRTLTPASLNIYLDCSLKFYFRYILQLQVQKQLLIEDTEAVRFGSLFHEVMEKLYTSLQTTEKVSPIQIHDIEALKTQVPLVVAQIFSHGLYDDHALPWGGQYLIEQEVMQKVVNRMLEIDGKYAPFLLVGLEVGKKAPLVAHFQLKHGKMLALRGIIDRVDLKQDSMRIIDYKTGGDENYVESISHLFDRNIPRRNRAIFQTFLYAWIFKQHANNTNYKILPSIVNTRSIFEANFDTRLMVKQGATKDYSYIEDITSYQNEFETGLDLLLEEILDPYIPFIQTENRLQCRSCPYKRICQR